jgi:quercetin dioxygenase-like cupin family protein
LRILLRGEDTGGRVAILQDAVPPRWHGPPLHHHGWDEAFYVLEGELTFRVAGTDIVRRAGEAVFAPRSSHHTFANLSDRPASYLVVCTPAGFERYFDPEPRGARPARYAVGPPIPVPAPCIDDASDDRLGDTPQATW